MPFKRSSSEDSTLRSFIDPGGISFPLYSENPRPDIFLNLVVISGSPIDLPPLADSRVGMSRSRKFIAPDDDRWMAKAEKTDGIAGARCCEKTTLKCPCTISPIARSRSLGESSNALSAQNFSTMAETRISGCISGGSIKAPLVVHSVRRPALNSFWNSSGEGPVSGEWPRLSEATTVRVRPDITM
jgi:hypothetical protein